MTANKPILSKRAFPDIDMDSIDYQASSLYVMERILQRGTLEDFDELRKFYGHKRIRKEIIYSKCLEGKDLSFTCVVFDLKSTNFIYYVEKPRAHRSEAETYNPLYPYNMDGEFIGER